MPNFYQTCKRHNQQFMAECFICKQELHDLQYPAYALNRKKSAEIRRLDATFHEARNYMTPATYQGKEILAYIGSCKESGCRNIARHISREGRDRLVWTHRREHILAYRLAFFEKALGSDGAIQEAMTEHADKHTHTFDEWKELVETIYSYLMDPNPVIRDRHELPPFQYEVYWNLGFTAHDAAKRVADRVVS